MAENGHHDADRATDSDRLRALEEKLARARGETRPKPPADDKYRQANQAWRMVIELVAGLVIGFGIGFGLDHLFGTTPILLVVFILLGFVAGIKTVLRTAAEMADPAAQPAEPVQTSSPATPASTSSPVQPAGTNSPATPAGTKGTQRGD